MSFYLRKSIRVGPIRFNLSKSGIGVSAGIPGFRISAGPRGNYVHMGRGGVYYRKTLSPTRTSQSPVQDASVPPPIPDPSRPKASVGPMVEIESGNTATMQDSSSKELLQELDEKSKIGRLGPVVGVVAVIAVCALFAAGVHPVIQVFIDMWWGAALYLAFRRDAFLKTVLLFYSFDPALERAYEVLHSAAAELANCAGCWHIAASETVEDRKYHAGASALVDRKATSIRRASPKFLKTNVETIRIEVGKQTMFLFPDRVLIYESGKVGAIGYDQLQISISQTQFIESSPPRDARVVGQTWRYVNKTGGPDRRFADNQSLSICLYDEVHLSSSSGLNEVIQLSKCGISHSFEKAVVAIGLQLLAGKNVRS